MKRLAPTWGNLETFARHLPANSVKFSASPLVNQTRKDWPPSSRHCGDAVIKIINKAAGSRSEKDIRPYIGKLSPFMADKNAKKMTWKEFPKSVKVLADLDPIDFDAESDDYSRWPSKMKQKAQAVKSLIMKV